MPRLLKRLLVIFALFAVLGTWGYTTLVLDSPKLEIAPFDLNISEVRALANSLSGDKPAEIRVEHVADFVFAKAMVVAGDPWQATPIPVLSYQLRYADYSVIVDTAMSSTDGIPEFMVGGFYPAAYARLSAALSQAKKIVITHEHSDHIGGLLAHPQLSSLLPAIQLTQEQWDHPDRMAPVTVPEESMRGYQALKYERLHALAPGVVLIKAPGHTPGSQMVYIQLHNDEEVLLLGDVAWQYRSLDMQRERPLFMTALIKEDRQAVLAQFHSLAALAQAEPQIHLMPGHDQQVLNTLLEAGVLKPEFIVNP